MNPIEKKHTASALVAGTSAVIFVALAIWDAMPPSVPLMAAFSGFVAGWAAAFCAVHLAELWLERKYGDDE